jgi:hypothetical protein
MPRAPTPELTVKAPPVAVTFNAPEPDWTVVVLVVFVEPNVVVFTPAPVDRFTVVAAASPETVITPVPVASVKIPFVVVYVDPAVPVSMLTAVAPVTLPIVIILAIEVPILIAPVPEFIATAVVDVTLPMDTVCATAFVPIFMLEPVPPFKETACC